MAELTGISSELEALIGLLDDPDASVQRAVRQRLQDMGPAVIGPLRHVQEEVDEPLKSILSSLTHDLHLAELLPLWQRLLQTSNPDLEEGAFLLARYRFPDLNVPAYRAQLDGFADRAEVYVRREKGYKRALVLSRFMCDVLGFEGNHVRYFDPENSYLNRVIDRRRGIPISLSSIYLLLGWRLRLPVYGVNMPSHFLVKYRDDELEVFLDLFNRGLPVKKEDAVQFLNQAGIESSPVHFTATDVPTMLLRMVRNLAMIAEQNNQAQDLAAFNRLLNA